MCVRARARAASVEKHISAYSGTYARHAHKEAEIHRPRRAAHQSYLLSAYLGAYARHALKKAVSGTPAGFFFKKNAAYALKDASTRAAAALWPYGVRPTATRPLELLLRGLLNSTMKPPGLLLCGIKTYYYVGLMQEAAYAYRWPRTTCSLGGCVLQLCGLKRR